MIALNNIEITEQLFEAIDAIVQERLRQLPYDKTVIATIVSNGSASFGKYQVTTDDNITFYAYSEITTYVVGNKVYVRIPQNDYTKQKIITGRYIPDGNTATITEVKSNQLVSFKEATENSVKNLQQQIDELTNQIDSLKNTIESIQAES